MVHYRQSDGTYPIENVDHAPELFKVRLDDYPHVLGCGLAAFFLTGFSPIIMLVSVLGAIMIARKSNRMEKEGQALTLIPKVAKRLKKAPEWMRQTFFPTADDVHISHETYRN